MGTMRAGVVLALIGLGAGACATKGYVMRQVQAAQDSSRMGWRADDATVRTDLSNQITSTNGRVDSLSSRLDALSRDLQMLRDSVGATITALQSGLQFALPVTFAFDDATVRPEARTMLDRFVRVVNKHYDGSVVTVEGFADPAGTVAYNRELSKDRADNVIDYLHQAGLSSSIQVKSVAMGETRQVVKGAEREMPGAEANRRVVFVIESAGQQGPATVTQ